MGDRTELEVVSALCAHAILARNGFGAGDEIVREILRDISDRMKNFPDSIADYEADPRTYRNQLEIALARAKELAAGPDRLVHLMLSFEAAGDVWRNEERTGGQLLALVSMRPHWLGRSGIYYRAYEPALVFYDGSWRCSLTRFAKRSGQFVLNAGAFAIALVRASIGAASTSAMSLVETLRTRAEQEWEVPLKRLDQLEPEDFHGKKGIILLLHGLFSTDARTFDGFLKRWRDDAEFKDLLADAVWRNKCHVGSESLIGKPNDPSAKDFARAYNDAIENDFLVVGWPHNTLTSITENADQLIRLLKAKLGDCDARILFVCHSRGGLLARQVAASAFHDKSCSNLRSRFVGCVTFGTPHEGAPLAEREKPMQKLAALLVIGSGTGNLLSVVELLAYYRQEKEIRGVDDLAPSSVRQGKFLQNLQEKERDTTNDPVKERYLPILPVGGDFAGGSSQGKTRLKRVFQHISGFLLRGENDLIVELSSSRPAIGFNDVIKGGLLTYCDHSGYFDDDQVRQQHFNTVIEKIREFLAFDSAVCARVTPHSEADGMSPADQLRQMLKRIIKDKNFKLKGNTGED